MTDDPGIAASIMESTAGANARVQDPVYHLTVAFHPEDVVSRDTMLRAADRVLADLRLADRQVLMVAHSDTAHAHVHLMVNRVHPETFIAWDRWRDFVTIDRTLRALEREWNLHSVEGPTASRTPDASLAKNAHSPTDPARNLTSAKPTNVRPEPRGRQHPEPDLVTAAADAVRGYDAATRAHELADHAEETALQAEDRQRRWQDATARAEEAMSRFTAALSQIYVSPPEAVREYFVRAPNLAYEGTRDLFAETPTILGIVRTDRVNPTKNFDAQLTARAIEAYEAVRDYHALWHQYGVRESVAEAALEINDRALKATRQADQLQEARAAAGSPAERHRQLQDALRRLTPRDRSRLRRVVDPLRWAATAQAIARLARPLLGHDEAER